MICFKATQTPAFIFFKRYICHAQKFWVNSEQWKMRTHTCTLCEKFLLVLVVLASILLCMNIEHTTKYTFACVFATHTGWLAESMYAVSCICVCVSSAVDRKVWNVVCLSSFFLLLNLIALERSYYSFMKNVCTFAYIVRHAHSNEPAGARLIDIEAYFCHAMPYHAMQWEKVLIEEDILDQWFNFQ